MNSEQVFAAVGTALVNITLFVGMAAASFVRAEAATEAPEFVPVSVVELPRLGQEPKPNALPRIVKPPPPPPPDTDVASLSREKKLEELEQEKKKERELAEEKKREEAEERARKRAERKERRDRKRAMAKALSNIDDPRADEDTPDGLKDGLRDGTSTDPNFAKNRNAYVSLVSAILNRQFKPPSTIPADELKRLTARVRFKIDKGGKLKGQPSIVRSSGNRQFDQQVLYTVRKFGPGSQFKIMVPPTAQRELRKTVLKKGITATMYGKKR